MYREPVDESLTTDRYKRDHEVENMIALMNMLHDLGLHAWNGGAPAGDTMQRKLSRMFRSKSIMSWAELLADAVAGKLELSDTDDKARKFYRELSKEQLEKVRAVVLRLFSWKFWSDAANTEIDRVLSDNKSVVKKWFRDHELTTGYLMGASS